MNSLWWSTPTYLAGVECTTCHATCPNTAALDVAKARRWAREHVAANPDCRVSVDVGRSTVYGERKPS